MPLEFINHANTIASSLHKTGNTANLCKTHCIILYTIHDAYTSKVCMHTFDFGRCSIHRSWAKVNFSSLEHIQINFRFHVCFNLLSGLYHWHHARKKYFNFFSYVDFHLFSRLYHWNQAQMKYLNFFLSDLVFYLTSGPYNWYHRQEKIFFQFWLDSRIFLHPFEALSLRACGVSCFSAALCLSHVGRRPTSTLYGWERA